ncbi:MAG: hypothetical protein JRN67_00855 [Nitrososphaerota archaeon]|nr:hypothetical protein [Nitrososphaerota archaeon]
MNQADDLKQTTTRSKTQMLTGIALFAALAIMLNFVIKVPAPYAPFLFYEVWEIPIIAVLLIFGMYSALTVSVLNAAVLIVAFPGSLPTGPLYNLAAIIVTLAAISVSHSLGSKVKLGPRNLIIIATGSAILVRSVAMVVFNFLLLPLPAPIGFTLPPASLLPLLPLIGFFNATVALYSVPIAYAVVKAVTYRFRFKLAYPLLRIQKATQ